MRLRHIEAVRYGALADASLSDLGDGLTVVHGPNEAGKSTFTSLVRHVLYGFPTARGKEAAYLVPDGKRLARLVFEDDAGRWVIERSAGTYGGDVHIPALEGPARPDLLTELVRGVSPHAYQVVFGFGLDEMPHIEEVRGTDDDIIQRLYAASAGLRVSPHEVCSTIRSEAEAIFKPSARKRDINTLTAEIRDVRARLRDLRKDADAYAADRERLAALGEQLVGAREARDAARARATELALAAGSAEERIALIGSQEEQLLELRRQRKQLDDEREAITLDVDLLDAAPALEAVMAEAAGVSQLAEQRADAEAALARASGRARDAARQTGLSDEVLAALGDPRDLTAEAEEARDDLQRMELQCQARDETTERANMALQEAQAASGRTLGPLGIELDAAGEVVAERLAALDAVESLRGGAVLASRRGVDVPALIMLVSGLAAAITGVMLREWITAGIGGVLVVAGIWFFVRSRAGVPALPMSDERPYLKILDLEPPAGTLELSRARRSLEAASVALSTMREVAARAEEASRDAAIAQNTLATRRTLWEAWLSTRGLDASLSPTAAVRVLASVAEARAADAVVAEAQADVDRVLGRMDALATRLADAARPFVTLPDPLTAADIPALVNRLSERLAAERAALTQRTDLARQVADLDSRIEAEELRATRARSDLRGILERFDLADGGTHEGLRVLQAGADRSAAEAEGAFDELAEAKNQLEGRLESGMHEQRGGELRLEEAGLAERLAETVDRYLVLSVAAHLLTTAQERYERERQPEVIKHAERVFSTITGGRYVGLTIPLDGGRIAAYDERAEVKSSDVLSRGAAEQLYLALRLGLIASLGDVGRGLPVLIDDVLVNFDPARKRGAAEAVAEMAASGRQVVFFTCHPETADLFAEVDPGHTRLDLACPTA